MNVLKCGDDDGATTGPEDVHEQGVGFEGLAEVGAEMKVDVEHHDVVGAGKELGDVAPHVELAVEFVDNEVQVDVAAHVWVVVVEAVKVGEDQLLGFVIVDVDRDGDGAAVVRGEAAQDLESVVRDERGDGDLLVVE